MSMQVGIIVTPRIVHISVHCQYCSKWSTILVQSIKGSFNDAYKRQIKPRGKQKIAVRMPHRPYLVVGS
jgi:urate oxidase